MQRKDIHKDSDSEDNDMGPMPLVNQDSNANTFSNQNQKSYGKELLPEEVKALAAYVQQNLRIPHGGEIGYDAEEIDHNEKSGYVVPYFSFLDVFLKEDGKYSSLSRLKWL